MKVWPEKAIGSSTCDHTLRKTRRDPISTPATSSVGLLGSPWATGRGTGMIPNALLAALPLQRTARFYASLCTGLL